MVLAENLLLTRTGGLAMNHAVSFPKGTEVWSLSLEDSGKQNSLPSFSPGTSRGPLLHFSRQL